MNMDYEFLTVLLSVSPFMPVLSIIMLKLLQNTGEHWNKWENWYKTGLPPSCIILKNGHSYFKSCGVHNARYLNYVCSFFKTRYEWVAKRVCLVLYVVDFSFWMAERPLESKQYVKK